MTTKDCPVYQLIREKVNKANGSRRLTKADREEVEEALKKCRDDSLTYNCDNPHECDRLNNLISDFAPPECRGSDHANARARDQRPSPHELPQLHAIPFCMARMPLRM